ncbi:hypothetical protein BCR44DRAFT_79216 [Catenaria anguillulae PL171]|uniref:Uncharacterized protein n=1 Tax=Catenaria anguillulae PL171 TaxID=765915 RepID=A0A1Y2HDW6_9FUNG|nr:hypothetical protein BCR44DRAFT_79216 [Catenaria anguillulae PL171]
MLFNDTLAQALANPTRRCIGVVACYNLKRGFGEILPNFSLSPAGSERRTVLLSLLGRRDRGYGHACQGYKHQQVEFRLEHGPKGYRAREVTGPGGEPFACRSAPCRKAPKPDPPRFSHAPNPAKVGVRVPTLEELIAAQPDDPPAMPTARPSLARASRTTNPDNLARAARARAPGNPTQPSEEPAIPELAQASLDHARATYAGVQAAQAQAQAQGLARTVRAHGHGAVVKRGASGRGSFGRRGGSRGGRGGVHGGRGGNNRHGGARGGRRG